jgi:hypothetical protein
MENNTNKKTIVPRNIRTPRRENVILPRVYQSQKQKCDDCE